jgi:hypothetical protein
VTGQAELQLLRKLCGPVADVCAAHPDQPVVVGCLRLPRSLSAVESGLPAGFIVHRSSSARSEPSSSSSPAAPGGSGFAYSARHVAAFEDVTARLVSSLKRSGKGRRRGDADNVGGLAIGLFTLVGDGAGFAGLAGPDYNANGLS